MVGAGRTTACRTTPSRYVCALEALPISRGCLRHLDVHTLSFPFGNTERLKERIYWMVHTSLTSLIHSPRKAFLCAILCEEGDESSFVVVDLDPQVNGGLMLIIGFVPDSEREYIQFLGRTARQDKRGQFAAVLLQSDYSAEAVGDFGDNSSSRGKQQQQGERMGDDAAHASVIRRVLEEGSLKTAKKLKSQKAVLEKGLQMNAVCESVFPRRDEEGFGSAQWTDLVRNYRQYDSEQIDATAKAVLPNAAKPAAAQPAAAAARSAAAAAGKKAPARRKR